MRSSRLNLILGIVWCGLWIYRAVVQLGSNGQWPLALTELAVVLPLGIGAVLDGIIHGMKPGVSFLNRPHWTISDYLFFTTGAMGLLLVASSPWLPWAERDLVLMGVLGVAVGGVHYYRRRNLMERAREIEGTGKP
jgi:hypothetical protein